MVTDVVSVDLADKMDHQQSIKLQSEHVGLVMNTLGLTALGIYYNNDRLLLVITSLLSRLLSTLLCCFSFGLDSSYEVSFLRKTGASAVTSNSQMEIHDIEIEYYQNQIWIPDIE